MKIHGASLAQQAYQETAAPSVSAAPVSAETASPDPSPSAVVELSPQAGQLAKDALKQPHSGIRPHGNVQNQGDAGDGIRPHGNVWPFGG